MRFSVGLPTDRVDRPDEFLTGDAVMEMARAVEAQGFDACYVTDHPAPDERWLARGGHHALEPLVGLAFAAAATTRLRLHTHTYVAAYRNPFLAAKSVASLDALSGGRVILGIAAGYLRPEFAALGVDFDERNDLLDEAIAVMRRAWSEDAVALVGRHFRAHGVTQRPRPMTALGPPLWIGGNSERAMRRAVEVGQGWSPFPSARETASAARTPAIPDLDTLATRLTAARAHAHAIGRREPLDLCFAPFMPEDDPAPFESLGVTWLAVRFDGSTTRKEWLERMGDYARRFIRR